MQTYETVLILKPALSDTEVADFVEKTKKMITSDGGEIVAQEIWGRRKLTHMIGKAREGVYAYFKFKAGSSILKKLGHNFSIAEQVMRAMTVLARDRKMREKKIKPKPVPTAAAS
ncbi:MAG: 30S ribosomal protein S6 [Elusimicrobia bacterium]|nr:30S ribosomal protein S6 [Elusimicrobiota bacterium]